MLKLKEYILGMPAEAQWHELVIFGQRGSCLNHCIVKEQQDYVLDKQQKYRSIAFVPCLSSKGHIVA